MQSPGLSLHEPLIAKSLLKSPDSIRVLSIFAVVVLHVAAAVVVYAPQGADWWAGNVYDSLVRWCVPVFVMLSGSLLLGKNESAAVFYRKRVARLAIPLMFWSLVYLAWSYQGEGWLWAVKKVLAGTPYFHLWFLYMIVGLYLLTPFLRLIVTHSSRTGLILLTSGLLAVAVLNTLHGAVAQLAISPPFFLNLCVPYLAYFIAGYLIATSTRTQDRSLLAAVFIAAVVLTCLGLFVLRQRYGIGRALYLYDYLSPTVVAMSIAAMSLLKDFSLPLPDAVLKRISGLTLGIYLVHPLFLEWFAHHKLDALHFPAALSVPVMAAAVFLCSCLAAGLLSRMPLLKRVI